MTFSLSRTRTPPSSTLFPYTTLFRSGAKASEIVRQLVAVGLQGRISELLLAADDRQAIGRDRKSTRLNSSHVSSSYAVFCLNKKNQAASATLHRSVHCHG